MTLENDESATSEARLLTKVSEKVAGSVQTRIIQDAENMEPVPVFVKGITQEMFEVALNSYRENSWAPAEYTKIKSSNFNAIVQDKAGQEIGEKFSDLNQLWELYN